MRNYIRMLIKYLPKVVNFENLYDAPLDNKRAVLDYLAEKLCEYAIDRLESENRGTLGGH
jgi:hypothetical protein